jgi:hypothetical protein
MSSFDTKKIKDITSHYGNEFVLHFKKVLETKGQEPFSPFQLLSWWAGFVIGCEEGYQWTIYEYYDEIGVREKIEIVLNDPQLQPHSEMAEFRKPVYAIDERFKHLALPGVETEYQRNWWERIILKRGGQEYADDIYRNYGVKIEVILD